MTTIKLKRVYEDYSEDDGLRVLVDRLWPRGVKKEELHYDIWAKDITPSNELRKWVHMDTQNRWDEFAIRYQQELSEEKHITPFIEKIKGYPVITLLYAAKDQLQNHALILKGVLEKELQKL